MKVVKKRLFQARDYIAFALILSFSVTLALGYDGYLRASLVGIGMSYGVIILPKLRK